MKFHLDSNIHDFVGILVINKDNTNNLKQDICRGEWRKTEHSCGAVCHLIPSMKQNSRKWEKERKQIPKPWTMTVNTFLKCNTRTDALFILFDHQREESVTLAWTTRDYLQHEALRVLLASASITLHVTVLVFNPTESTRHSGVKTPSASYYEKHPSVSFSFTVIHFF